MTAEEYAAQVKAKLKETWLPHIYRQRILNKRTRSYHFEGLTNKSRVEIQHTLLGVELKAGGGGSFVPIWPRRVTFPSSRALVHNR